MSIDFLLLTNTSMPIWQRSIGAYQVAHHCRKNDITCQVIDFVDLFELDDLENIILSFVTDKTLAIGVSTTFFYKADTTEKFIDKNQKVDEIISPELRELLVKVKSKFPNLKFIGGGASSYKLEEDLLFDVIFHGYSEQSVVEYIQELKGLKKKKLYPKKQNQIIIDGMLSHFDIQTLDHRWSISDCVLSSETLPIEISRGCIFKCNFCSYPLNGKKKFDYLRDPELIKDELIYNYENFRTTNYFFTDDTFNDSTQKLENLHKILTQLPFKIKFTTYLRIDLIHAHKEQIQLLKEMGLGSCFFGIETLNHESGKIIGKGMRPELVKEFLLELHNDHWYSEIPFTCSFIIGLPKEDKASIINTHTWIRTTPFNDLWFPLFIRKGEKYYYYSEFETNYEKYGYKLDDQGYWYNDIMNFQEALVLSEEFNSVGLYYDSKPSSWILFGLLSYGLTISEIKNLRMHEINWSDMLLKKEELFTSYKNLLITETRK